MSKKNLKRECIMSILTVKGKKNFDTRYININIKSKWFLFQRDGCFLEFADMHWDGLSCIFVSDQFLN